MQLHEEKDGNYPRMRGTNEPEPHLPWQGHGTHETAFDDEGLPVPAGQDAGVRAAHVDLVRYRHCGTACPGQVQDICPGPVVGPGGPQRGHHSAAPRGTRIERGGGSGRRGGKGRWGR